MEEGDFILYDDKDGEEHPPDVIRNKSAFLEHRATRPDTSPLFDETPYTSILNSNHSQSSSENVSRVSPATLRSVSPNTTPPEQPSQPSSGTLGEPLDLLSLHSADSDKKATLSSAPLFPHLPRDPPTPPNESANQPQPSQPLPPFFNDAHAAAAASLFWNPGNTDANENLRRWRSYWSMHGGNAPVPSMAAGHDVLRAQEQADDMNQTQPRTDQQLQRQRQQQQQQFGLESYPQPYPQPSVHSLAQRPNDKMTISPRELHLDYNEATTPPAKVKDPPVIGDAFSLFPSQSTSGHLPSQTMLSSGMETGSSTEEEDDEDEKPYTAMNGIHLGTTMPNEQLLQQWSRPMYGGVTSDLSITGTGHARDTDTRWPSFGPSFSSVSASSESEDELTDRMHRASRHAGPHSHTPMRPFHHTGSGTLSAYGYISGSQDSAMSTSASTDNESRRSSTMSMSVSESEFGGRGESERRSPSILHDAQSADPMPQLLSTRTPPPENETSAWRRTSNRHRRPDEPDRHATSTPTARVPYDSSSPHRWRNGEVSTERHGTNADVQKKAVIATSLQADADEDAGGNADNDMDANGDGDAESDYEQTHHISQPVTRTGSRRGRQRTMIGGPKTSTGAALHHHGSAGHQTDTSPRAVHGVARNNTSSPSGSIIRCDYVSPLTNQVCGTVFHRMYDLARHRITLHLREEAQLFKDGVLNLDQCVVLGKEVDVKKALAELEWTCRCCGATFSRKDALLRHERLRHHR